MSKCQVCGRELKSAKSIARGMGSVCAKKAKAGKGKRHQARLRSLGGSRSRLAGEPMTKDQALAAVRRVAGLP